MSDESQGTSVQSALPEIGDAVEQAVEGNAEQAAPETAEANSTQQVAAEAKATINNPKASKAEKKAAEKQLKKLKLKVDGEEYDEEFDPNDDKYLTEQLQLAKVARKRMQEKSLIEKEVLKFIEDLRKDPKKALSDPAIGLDLKQFAAQIIEEEIENSKKSPEQLALEQAQAELKALKEQQEREKEEFRTKEFERLKEQEFERYDQLMSNALEKTDLPKSPYIVKKMADYMLLGLQMGKEVTPDDVIPLVREEMQEDLKEMFAVMPEDVIEKLIGKDVINRIRKKNVAKAKQAASNPAVNAPNKVATTGKTSNQTEKQPEKKTNFKDFFKF